MRDAVGPGSEPNTRATFTRDGKENAAGARRVRRRHRRHHQVGEHDRVAEAERAAADARHDARRRCARRAGSRQAAREEERGEDQPDGDVAVAGEPVLDREEPQQRAGGDAADHQHAGGDRPRDQAADRRSRTGRAGPSCARRSRRAAAARSPPPARAGRSSARARSSYWSPSPRFLIIGSICGSWPVNSRNIAP